jgi:hypothetical protein
LTKYNSANVLERTDPSNSTGERWVGSRETYSKRGVKAVIRGGNQILVGWQMKIGRKRVRATTYLMGAVSA